MRQHSGWSSRLSVAPQVAAMATRSSSASLTCLSSEETQAPSQSMTSGVWTSTRLLSRGRTCAWQARTNLVWEPTMLPPCARLVQHLEWWSRLEEGQLTSRRLRTLGVCAVTETGAGTGSKPLTRLDKKSLLLVTNIQASSLARWWSLLVVAPILSERMCN